MDAQARSRLVQQYRDGVSEVLAALEGITEQELDRRPAPGRWSSRQIVHHLADSEMTAAIRVRLLLGEDRPTILAYDQEQFARRLHYDRPIGPSLDAFRAARESTAPILDRLSAEEWAREGTHTEVGRYTVDTWLQIYAEHAHKHAAQIRRARAGAG